MTCLLRLRVSALGLVAVCLAGAAALQTRLDAQTARTQERDLFVSVLDKNDEPVTDLDARAFIVRENGLVREVLRARRATDPIDLAIVVDNSQASTDDMMDLRRGLEPFAAQLAGKGHLALVTMADRPTIAVEYTSDPAALQKGVGRLFAMPGSGIVSLDSVSEVVRGLKKRDAARAALVVVYLGGREFSNDGDIQVLRDLRESGVALHVVTVGNGVPNDAGTPEGRSREIVFDQGTRQSGGRRWNVLSSMGLRDALDRLARELTSQYRITYARPDSLLPPDTVEVSVTPAGLTARGTPVRTPKKPSRP